MNPKKNAWEKRTRVGGVTVITTIVVPNDELEPTAEDVEKAKQMHATAVANERKPAPPAPPNNDDKGKKK